MKLFICVNSFLSAWEPLWLFVLLSLEAVSGLLGVWILAKRLAILTQKKSSTKKKKEEFECLTTGESK